MFRLQVTALTKKYNKINYVTQQLHYKKLWNEGALIKDYFDGSRFATPENDSNAVLSGKDVYESDSEDVIT